MSNNLNNIELRRLSVLPEIRAEVVNREDGTTAKRISGYAAVFEQYSRPFYDEWVEIISRGAFDGCEMSDVVMVIDHSREVRDVMARYKDGIGTLDITIDEQGVRFAFDAPDTAAGRDLVALIERGDISECSFAFWVAEDSWSYDVNLDGKTYDIRRINKVAKLADLSIVVRGQYPQPSVGIDERALFEASRPKQSTRTMSVALAKAITNH